MTPDRLSIGLIAPPWLPVPPPAYGGTELFVDVLARGLEQAGHEVVLFATGDSTSPVRRRYWFEHALGMGEAGNLAEPLQVVEAYRALDGVDIVHDNTVVGPLYARSLQGRRVVTTAHGNFDGPTRAVFDAFRQEVGVVAISHHQARSVGDWAPLAVVHHGLDLDSYPVGTGDGGYLLFLGRMHPDKGVHLAAEAARQVGLPLVIAAKMRERIEKEYFATKVRPLLTEGIEYVGEVGSADKLELLGGALCLLNPIQWPEPFGLVMAESLACGTPVVATPSGSAPEIVTHEKTGFLCAGRGSLLESLEKVEKIDRGECRRAAEEHFSSKEMVKGYLAAYGALLEGRAELAQAHVAA